MADNFAFLLQVLSQTGCQCHAVRLTALGITSVQALSDRASEAASQGVDAESIAKACLTSPHVVETPNRADLPVRRHYSSASFDAALQAAVPANRKRTLDDLGANLLARSPTRRMETRVKAWQRLCEAWDVRPWPISFDAIKKVCASLRQWGYTSVEGYLHAAFWYQEKEFGIEVETAKRPRRPLVKRLRHQERLQRHGHPHRGLLIHDAGDRDGQRQDVRRRVPGRHGVPAAADTEGGTGGPGEAHQTRPAMCVRGGFTPFAPNTPTSHAFGGEEQCPHGRPWQCGVQVRSGHRVSDGHPSLLYTLGR